MNRSPSPEKEEDKPEPKPKEVTPPKFGNIEPYEDDELSVEEAEELIRGHKIICTCHEDPDWCEKHNSFA